MPARCRITKRTVDALVAPKAGAAWLWDAEVRGFGVRARGHAKTYVLRYPAPGRPGASRWLTIGTHGTAWRPDPETGAGRVLTAELAREEAIRLKGSKDPAEVRGGVRSMPTLEAFARDRYLPDHSQARKATRSASGDSRMLDLHVVPQIGALQLDRIGPGEITRLHNRLKRTPFAANRVLSLLSHLFTKARAWGVVPPGHVNPCADVVRYPERKRKRYLSAEERTRVGAALATSTASPVAIAALRVLMLTGARPDEILRLRRDQIAAVIQQIGKTGERPIYFDRFAMEIILVLWPRPWPPGGNPFVFPSRNRGRHLTATSLSHVWQALRVRAGVPDVRLYDLRHTFASVAVQQGLGLPIIGELLGHKRGETTARYAHLSDEPVRAASDDVSAEIAKAFKG